MVSLMENSRHRFVGEAATVMCAIVKFRKYLWGSDFTVVLDCSEIQNIFGSEAKVPHVVDRWRAELLTYQFLIWHRQGIMM